MDSVLIGLFRYFFGGELKREKFFAPKFVEYLLSL
jgi:hypothetical protein